MLEIRKVEKNPQQNNYFSFIFLPAETNTDPLKNTSFPFSLSGSWETVISGSGSARTMLFNYSIIWFWQALPALSIHSILFTPCFASIASKLLWFWCCCCVCVYQHKIGLRSKWRFALSMHARANQALTFPSCQRTVHLGVSYQCHIFPYSWLLKQG